MKFHPSYKYAEDVIKGNIIAPKYVKKQCQLFLNICDNKDDKYCVNEKRVNKINKRKDTPYGKENSRCHF